MSQGDLTFYFKLDIDNYFITVWDEHCNCTLKNERKYSYSGTLCISVGHQPYISQVPLCVSKQMPVLIPKENETI